MNMRMNSKVLLIGFSIIIVSVVLIAMAMPNNLRRATESIEGKLLEQTPMGSQMSDVVKKLREMGYVPVISEVGFYRQEGEIPAVIGTKSIRAELGEYWAFPFFRTSVTAFWGFDDSDALINVWVWKTTDAP